MESMTRNSGFRLRNTAIILIGLNIAFFFLQQVVSGFTENLMLVSSDVFYRPWILLTSMFLHGSGGHLFFNMYALFLFGTLIEQRVGTKRFLMLYFASGILAGLGFAAFQELILGSTGAALGASGGMMGVLGITIVLLPHLKVLFLFFIPMSMRTAGIVIALIDLLGVFGVGLRGIANIAHLVGLACGIVYGVYLLKEKSRFHARFTSPRRTGAGRGKTRAYSNSTPSDVNRSIELSREELDDYLKHGRL